MKKVLFTLSAVAALSVLALMPEEGASIGNAVAWLVWAVGAGTAAVWGVVTAQRWHEER